MVQLLTHRQKRGLLIVLAAMVLIAGWRWRAGQRAAAGTAESTCLPAPAGAQAAARLDLNAADTTALQAVKGIGPVIARRIVRYRALIGGFTATDQLLQVFGITPENFIRIEEQVWTDTTTAAFASLQAGKFKPQTRRAGGHEPRQRRFVTDPGSYPPATGKAFPTSQGSATPTPTLTPTLTPTPTPAPTPAAMVDINEADSLDLVAISGIGPATARNILKYRSLIWYFDNLDQLSEVWGVRPENLERMKPYLSVGNAKEKMPHLAVNVMDVEQMGRHKYLGFKEARILVAYREMHGPFPDFAALQKVQGIAPEKLDKLRPYLQY